MYTFSIRLQVLKGECFSFHIAATSHLFSTICFSAFKGKQSEKLRSPFQFKANLQRSQLGVGGGATQFTPYITASHERISSSLVFPTFQGRIVHGKGITECHITGQACRRGMTPILIISSSGISVQILWSSGWEQFSAL